MLHTWKHNSISSEKSKCSLEWYERHNTANHYNNKKWIRSHTQWILQDIQPKLIFGSVHVSAAYMGHFLGHFFYTNFLYINLFTPPFYTLIFLHQNFCFFLHQNVCFFLHKIVFFFETNFYTKNFAFFKWFFIKFWNWGNDFLEKWCKKAQNWCKNLV